MLEQKEDKGILLQELGTQDEGKTESNLQQEEEVKEVETTKENLEMLEPLLAQKEGQQANANQE